MWEATLDAKGRIVLPKALRDALDLVAGKRVRLSVEGNRIVITTSISPGLFAAKMKGCVKEGSAVAETDPLELKRMWNHHLPEIRSKIPIVRRRSLGTLGRRWTGWAPSCGPAQQETHSKTSKGMATELVPEIRRLPR